MTIPNGPDDVATFGETSPLINLTFPTASLTVLNQIVLTPSSNIDAIVVPDEASLTVVGAGVTNPSGVFASLDVDAGGAITFQNSAASFVDLLCAGTITFQDTASGMGGLFIFGSQEAGESGGVTIFADQSKAAQTIILYAGSNGGAGGVVYFNDDSTADEAFIALEPNTIVDPSGHTSSGARRRFVRTRRRCLPWRQQPFRQI